MSKNISQIINDEKSKIISQIKKEFEASNKRTLKSFVSSEDGVSNSFALCLGTGVSADINKAVNGSNYLWNGLVYGVAGELLKGIVTSELFIAELQELKQTGTVTPILPKDDTAKNEYINGICNAIMAIVQKEKFLSTDNTMECVEFLKYIAFPQNGELKRKEYAENIISLITNKLFNGKRPTTCRGGLDPIENMIKELNTIGYKLGEGNTLIEVCSLIACLKDKHPVDVLTYNYDDFLETGLNACFNINARTIYNQRTQTKLVKHYSSSGNKNDNVNIYHVHGYVPRQDPDDLFDILNETDFVFSETSYDSMSNEIYRWSNRIQADFFSSRNVMFVGFSGVDVNFRKLMKEVKRLNPINSPCHIMFMNYSDIINFICCEDYYHNILDNKIGVLPYTKTALHIIMEIIEAKKRYYKEQLGIDLIWHEKITDIPDIIHRTIELFAD